MATNNVEDYRHSTHLLAATTLRNVLGTKCLAQVFCQHRYRRRRRHRSRHRSRHRRRRCHSHFCDHCHHLLTLNSQVLSEREHIADYMQVIGFLSFQSFKVIVQLGFELNATITMYNHLNTP